jgi:hypothetical protein
MTTDAEIIADRLRKKAIITLEDIDWHIIKIKLLRTA